MRLRPLTAPALGSLLTLAACGTAADDDDDAAPTCDGPYTPFNADNYANQVLRVGAYEDINTIRRAEDFEAADFAEIEALYTGTADLAAKVQGRTDDHDYATVVEVGALLHAAIDGAIDAGLADDQIDVQAQIVDKTLQRFFYLSVYHYIAQASDASLEAGEIQKGWDEAFGYFGTDTAGTTTRGISTTLSKRDDEFGTSLVQAVWNGLVDGKCAIEAGDLQAVAAIADDMDRALLDGFALSVVHEMDEYAEDPLIKGWEGKLYWDIVADYAGTLDPAARATVDAEFEAGVDQVDPQVVSDAVIGVFGFSI